MKKTEQGKIIIPFYKIVTTHGVPLETAVEILHMKDFMPDWMDFLEYAAKDKWHLPRLVERLYSIVSDIYGVEWAQEWRTRADLVLTNHLRGE